MAKWYDLLQLNIQCLDVGEIWTIKSSQEFFKKNKFVFDRHSLKMVDTPYDYMCDETDGGLKVTQQFFIITATPLVNSHLNHLNFRVFFEDYMDNIKELWAKHNHMRDSIDVTLVFQVSNEYSSYLYEEYDYEWVGVLDYDKIENAMVKI